VNQFIAFGKIPAPPPEGIILIKYNKIVMDVNDHNDSNYTVALKMQLTVRMYKDINSIIWYACHISELSYVVEHKQVAYFAQNASVSE
jgi:hypothetical protein